MLAEIQLVPLFVALVLGAAAGVGLALAFGRKGVRLREVAVPDPFAVGGGKPEPDPVDVEALREQQSQTLVQLRERIAEVQAQRDRAHAERQRLMDGLNAIGGNVGDGVTVALSSAKEMAEKARQLGEHESSLSASDNELAGLKDELTAAEELLSEVDSQREALKKQVQDQSSELYKLRSEIQASHQKVHVQRARTMMLTRSNVRKTEVVANRLEDQLKAWVKKTGVQANFSEHGHASIVREAYEKLDVEFIDRYFSHATNPEYERGKRRAIHVGSAKDQSGAEYGELRIALDDDAGRTLGLRFELKKGAPEAKAVGLVLAMYLKAMHRDLREFEIHAG